MSSNLTEAGPVNPLENASAIAPSEACEGSDTSLELTPIQDEYEGVDWDRVDRYQWPHRDLLRTPSFIWDHGWRLQQRFGDKTTVFLCKYCHLHKIKVTLYKTSRAIISTAGYFAKDINGHQVDSHGPIDYTVF
jgi:hypothetical protein